MIELKNVFKTYKSKKGPNTEALKNININFDNKGMTFVLGKSGSGKSTLLNLLGGLDTPTSGEILFNGKSLNNYKPKDFDAYRNNYIGFVFQEYNLLEKYNVFENVAFPLKLQNEKNYDEKVLNVLDQVGLKDLKDRKVNELSGGQKQRVAIARALVKNPKVILADEPTGNLDSESSKIVFDVLKRLSNDILVIVISHDEENAKLYSDRIIYLKDGEIVAVTQNNEVTQVQELSSKKSKLHFKDTLYIAYRNIFNRKGKLILSIILISITISLFGLSIMQKYIREKQESVRLLEKYNAKFLEVRKLVKEPYVTGPLDGYYRNDHNPVHLKDEDFNIIKEKYSLDFKKAYYFVDSSGERIAFLKPINPSDNENYTFEDMIVMYNFTAFEELDSNSFNFKLIGRKPNNYEEIVISKTYADYMINNGTYLYEEDYENTTYQIMSQRTNDFEKGKRKIYKPSSYEEIISDSEYLAFGFGKVKIVGIIDEDLSKYNDLLKCDYKQYVTKYDEEYKEFIQQRLVNIYVLDGFKDKFDLKIKKDRNAELHVDKNTTNIHMEEDLLNEYNLSKNEVIVPNSYLDYISNGNYSKELNDYVIKKMEEDSSLGSNYYKEEFIKKYLEDNKIIGSSIRITYGDREVYTNVSDKEISQNLTIKDIKDVNSYIVNKDSLPDISYNFVTFIETNNRDDYVKALNEMEIDGSEYVLHNDLIDIVARSSFSMKLLSVYLFVIALFFSLFAVLQLFNYINTSILDNKKEIGILRSLGTSKFDICKIYLLQGCIVALVCYLLALALCYLYSIFENSMFFGSMQQLNNFDIKMIGIVWQSALIMFVFLFVMVLLSSISAANKISKLKPIDAINDK